MNSERERVRLELAQAAAGDSTRLAEAVAALATLAKDPATAAGVRVLARAMRVIGRQVIRLTRLATDLSSSDVGADDV